MLLNETHSLFQNLSWVENHPVSGNIEPLVSKDVTDIITLITYGIVSQALSIFSIIGNIINMVIFIKMGLKESINVSLLALAMADIGACVTYLWLNLCVALNYVDNLSFIPNEIVGLTARWPHLYFARVSGFITGFITFERCLCVIAPLKVKTIITHKRFIIFTVFTCLLFLGTLYPLYHTCRLEWKFFPHVNRSLLALSVTDDGKLHQIVLVITNGFFPPFIFCFISTATAVLVIALKKAAQWRRTTTTGTSSGQPKDISTKEQKICKMVIMVSAFSIACYLPQLLISLAIIVEPKLNLGMEYANMGMIMYSLVNIPEAANPAANIFIYYFKSSNYRVTFDRIFRNKSNQ